MQVLPLKGVPEYAVEKLGVEGIEIKWGQGAKSIGADGGTAMSPWRMMNEWGKPTVYLESLLYRFLKRLDEKGEFIPSCAIAGGISLEDHLFKAIALGAPYIKAVYMGRAALTAAMVGKTQEQLLQKKHKEGKESQEASTQIPNESCLFICRL